MEAIDRKIQQKMKEVEKLEELKKHYQFCEKIGDYVSKKSGDNFTDYKSFTVWYDALIEKSAKYSEDDIYVTSGDVSEEDSVFAEE